MLQGHQKKYLFGISLSVAVGLTILAIITFSQPTYVVGEEVTKDGQIVCLPHKKGIFGGVDTLECAMGLASDGKFYGLENLLETARRDQALLEKIRHAPVDKAEVRISGTFTSISQEYERYKIVGVIVVKHIELE